MSGEPWDIAGMTAAGYLLRSRYDQVADYLGPVATVVLTIVAATYIIRILRWKRA